MSKRLFWLAAALLAASMILAACAPAAATETAAPTTAPTGPATSGGTIKIATQSPLSGGQSALGVDIKNGAELALEQFGGPLRDMGFTLELAPYDDQANPDTGVANAKQIVADPDILCGVGHLNSGVMIPSSEEYHAAGLAFVSPANTNPTVTDREYLEVNRIVGRDDVQGVVGAEFAADQGFETVYIVHDKTTYGQGIAEFFQQKAEELGMTVAGFEGTEEKANFDALITPILTANPDLVYFGGIYDQAGVFFKQTRERGYEGTFMGPDGMDSTTLPEIAGDALISGGGMFYSTVAGPANVYPGTAKFIEDFTAKYGAAPQPFSAQAFDAMGICLKAIESASMDASGLPTRAAVAEAIRALEPYAGVTGTYTFNDIGDVTSAKYFVIKVLSADPAAWGNNSVEQTLDIAPPSQ
jgi:branched-chain amino acid transport system substrate-binding protein